MNKLLYSGLVTHSRSISVSGTLITQNHVHYIIITFIHLTSPFFYHIFLNISLISSHVNIPFALNSEHTSILCHIHGPSPRTTRPCSSTYSTGHLWGSAPISEPDLGAHLGRHTVYQRKPLIFEPKMMDLELVWSQLRLVNNSKENEDVGLKLLWRHL